MKGQKGRKCRSAGSFTDENTSCLWRAKSANQTPPSTVQTTCLSLAFISCSEPHENLLASPFACVPLTHQNNQYHPSHLPSQRLSLPCEVYSPTPTPSRASSHCYPTITILAGLLHGIQSSPYLRSSWKVKELHPPRSTVPSHFQRPFCLPYTCAHGGEELKTLRELTPEVRVQVSFLNCQCLGSIKDL